MLLPIRHWLDKLPVNLAGWEPARLTKNFMKNKILFKYLPAISWSAFIFFGCFLPGNDLLKEDWLDKIYFDKIVHASFYFILFFLLLRIPEIKTTIFICFAILLCIAQGILIEFVQGSSLIQNRSFDVYDIAANIFGVLMAVIIFTQKHKTN